MAEKKKQKKTGPMYVGGYLNQGGVSPQVSDMLKEAYVPVTKDQDRAEKERKRLEAERKRIEKERKKKNKG